LLFGKRKKVATELTNQPIAGSGAFNKQQLEA